jgi:hypothetical protein
MLKYPNLARFAINVITILTLLCNCERMFSKLSNLLKPKRQAIGLELLAAIQLVRSWWRASFKLPPKGLDTEVTDEQLVREY